MYIVAFVPRVYGAVPGILPMCSRFSISLLSYMGLMFTPSFSFSSSFIFLFFISL